MAASRYRDLLFSRRSHSRSQVTHGGSEQRRLQFESLEDRRMLAVFTVDNLNDSGAGSLRDAISLANGSAGPDEIVFTGAATDGTIALTSGELEVTDALTITGPGQDQFTIDAQLQSRVLNFTGATGDLNLSGLTLQNGRTTGNGVCCGVLTNTYNGGGIRFVSNGTLTLANSLVEGNGTTGEFALGGGIFSQSGDISLTDSTVRNNSTSGAGSSNGHGSKGGGISTISGSITLHSSSVTGNSTIGAQSGDGGGIYTDSGTVTLNDSRVSDNFLHGSRFLDGAGIRTRSGDVTLNDSVLSGNNITAAFSGGGGISSVTGNVTLNRSMLAGNSVIGTLNVGTGGIGTRGDVTLNDSVVSDNTTQGNTGGIATRGAVILNNSTVSNNSSASRGGGISLSSFGSASLTLTNSTLSGNTSGAFGGGIYADTGTSFIQITNSTLFDNEATLSGGAIFIVDGNNPTVTIENSIIAGNRDNINTPNDLVTNSGSTPTINHSLIGVADGLTIIGNVGNQTGTQANPFDASLGPLQDNGGPTETHAPLAGSPAIDMGDPNFASPPDFDQRGQPFARVFNSRIDVGALEVQPPPVSDDADFDADTDVDGADFLAWQRGFGTPMPNAQKSDGDADNDMDVDADDLGIWQAQYGQVQALVAGAGGGQSATASVALLDAAMAWEWFSEMTNEEANDSVEETADYGETVELAEATAEFAPAVSTADNAERIAEPIDEATELAEPWLDDELLDRVFG